MKQQQIRCQEQFLRHIWHHLLPVYEPVLSVSECHGERGESDETDGQLGAARQMRVRIRNPHEGLGRLNPQRSWLKSHATRDPELPTDRGAQIRN